MSKNYKSLIRLLSKLQLLAKITLFGIFFVKFFDHMFTNALKIFQKICSKIVDFLSQSKFRKKSILALVLSFFICSCDSQSLEDYREEGEAISMLLIKELSHIHTRDQLIQASPKLKHLFGVLVDIMIAAQQFRERQSLVEPLEPSSQSLYISELLRAELNRIYQIEGARSIVEKCQEYALHRLDGYEKKKKSRDYVLNSCSK